MIAFSGVRSSCDMFARNCDFSLLASASCSLFAWLSLNSRAFSMARTDCEASVCSSLTIGGANSPDTLRRITSAPVTCSSRSSGTAITDRMPSLAQNKCVRGEIAVRLASSASESWTGARCTAHMPTGPSPRPIRKSRSAWIISSLTPKFARGPKTPSASSNW